MKWEVDAALDSLSRETQALEQVRRAIISRRSDGTKRMFLMVGGGVLAAVSGVVISGNLLGFVSGILVVLIGGIATYSKYFSGGKGEYRSLFKTKLISKLIRWVEPGMTYDPYREIADGMFVQSGLFSKMPDRYASEELIHGKIRETKLMFSKVHAEERYTTTDSKGRSQARWRDIFKGMFVCADFHKDFRLSGTVMSYFAERTFFSLGRSFRSLVGTSYGWRIRSLKRCLWCVDQFQWRHVIF